MVEKYEQDCIDNKIKQTFMKTMQWTKHIYQIGKKRINKSVRLKIYLHGFTLQRNNTL